MDHILTLKAQRFNTAHRKARGKAHDMCYLYQWWWKSDYWECVAKRSATFRALPSTAGERLKHNHCRLYNKCLKLTSNLKQPMFQSDLLTTLHYIIITFFTWLWYQAFSRFCVQQWKPGPVTRERDGSWTTENATSLVYDITTLLNVLYCYIHSLQDEQSSRGRGLISSWTEWSSW